MPTPARTSLGLVFQLAVALPIGAALNLDPTFGQGGKVTTPFAGNGVEARDVAIQADGKILAVGQTGDVFLEDVALARYLTDGSLDATFGSAGRVVTSVGPLGDTAQAVVIQPDGRIVVAGSMNLGPPGPDSVFVVARYTADGSLDPTFGTGGIVLTDFVPNEQDAARSVALQPDGKIIAAGLSGLGLPVLSQFALARYNADGSLDPTFGAGGKAQVDMGGDQDAINAITLLSDGRILTCGLALDAGLNNRFALALLLADGSLDATFGSGGRVFTSIGAGSSGCFGMRLQSDGKIVAFGGAPAPAPISGDFAVVRYLPDGSLDPTFGSGGYVTTRLAGSSGANDGVVLGSGQLLAVGYSFDPFDTDFALAGHLPSGLPDPDLGPEGWLMTDFGGHDGAAAIAVQTDGKIVVAGGGEPQGQREFALARYVSSPAGSLTPIPVLGGAGYALLAGLLGVAGWVAIRNVVSTP